MSLIVDASVAVKWYVDEPFSKEAASLLSRADLAAPSLIFAEVGNALWKRVRRGASSLAQSRAALSGLQHTLTGVEPIETLFRQAMDVATEFDHPIYDCFYIALAARQRVAIVTADERMAAVAEQSGVEIHFIGTMSLD
jgi:predicted nucleic acid-binding protein